MLPPVVPARGIRVHHLSVPARQQFVDMPYGIQRAAVGAVGVLLRLQVGLEDRLQDQHRRHLHDTILDRWNAQRSCLAIRLWDMHPPHGCRLIPPAFQLLRQFIEPPVQPVLLDVLETLVIHTRRSFVGFAAVVGVNQNVSSIHFVVQGVEPIVRRSLRFGM
jgi:hypothetical protein